MKPKKSSNVARIAIFFATMVVIDIVLTTFTTLFPLLISPTLVHVPVIIASLVYGWRTGATLGGLMGTLSVIHNTIMYNPTSSFLFSPFVKDGNFYSLLVALMPRILIGITPYLVYKFIQNKAGLGLAAAVGSFTNTLLVLGGIFFLFPTVYGGNLQKFIGVVVGTNSILEIVLSVVLTLTIVPRLKNIVK